MIKRTLVIASALGAGAALAPGGDEGPKVLVDASGDATFRRTDLGSDGPMHPSTTPVDLLELSIGPWDPDDAGDDPYAGDWEDDDDGDFVRIDLVFAGVVNPPGNVLGAQPFNPFRYGFNPLHGALEIDVDRDKNTGGECDDPALYRYLANVGRFGAAPYGSLSERIARRGEHLNTLFGSDPQIERSGAEFVVSLCGCFNTTVQNTFGDASPTTFGAGDRWLVRGRFFQRTGGFQDASFVFGGSFPGLYDPQINVLFQHHAGSNRTTVSIVFPLTPAGAGELAGQAPAPMDLNVANQFSVQEALEDVIAGAAENLPPGCVYELIRHWDGRDSDDYLEPADWDVLALFGTTYSTLQSPYYYVWSDTGFDDRVGDFDGTGVVDTMDVDAIDAEIAARDGGASDADGAVNGAVVIPMYSSAFSLYDVNNDGVIDGGDGAAIGPALVGDLNGDCAVNFADLNIVVSFFNTASPAGDVNGDGSVNFADLNLVVSNFNTTCR